MPDCSPMRPTVTVACVAYNHEDYITAALDSILMQRTSFPIEVIVHDDASSDRTPAIVLEYAKKFPDIVIPILQTENQYAQGNIHFWSYVWPRARGRYIALCGGDDFWTDPRKLEKQVALLDANPMASVSCHQATICDADGTVVEIPNGFPKRFAGVARLPDVLEGNFMVASTVMFRAFPSVPFPTWARKLRAEDWVLHILNAMRGDILCSDDYMACYRRHPRGLWSGRTFEESLVDFEETIDALNAFDVETGRKHHANVERGITSVLFYRAQTYLDGGNRALALTDALKVLMRAKRPRRLSLIRVLALFLRGLAPSVYRVTLSGKRAITGRN